MRLPDLLPPGLLPTAELAAMRLDGEVYAVGPAWRPVDLPETAEARAGAVAEVFGSAIVADRETAAWVLGATDSPPEPLTGCVPISARVAARKRREVDVRELRLADAELLKVGGVCVTDEARTAIDLLRGEDWGGRIQQTVSALVARCGAAEVRRRLADRRFAAYRSRTLARLAELVPPIEVPLTR